MATNYERGRSFEYRVIKYLKELGFSCIRSAGSKGSIDIIAGNGDSLYAVQCKRDGRLPKDEHKNLLRDAAQFCATPILAMLSPKLALYALSKSGFRRRALA